MQQFRSLTALANGAGIRAGVFDGREHLVAPVVLAVAGIVVRPVTGDGRGELITADALKAAPGSWNGRPVTAGHPTTTANDPGTLERLAFGRVFNAAFRDGRLVGEIWLDPVQAEAVGADAVSVVDRLRQGRAVEISVGAWVTLEARQGTANGERFDVIWLHLAPDHLAMLPVGQPGACSITDGCGAGRTAFMAAQACAPTADDVLDAIARTQYERESRRIRHAAALDPPPDPYSIALEKRRHQRR